MSSRSLVVLFWLLLAPLVAIAAEAKTVSLHLESAPASKVIWLVEVREGDRPDIRYSRIYSREEGNPLWRLSRTVPAEIRQVTRYGNDLVALLPNGDWMIVGQSSGRRLPGLIAIAGDDRSLFAIADATAPATRPTTAPAVEAPATTRASTRPASLALYELVRGDWKMKAALPRRAAGSLALAAIDGLPTLAALQDRQLGLWQFSPEGKWANLGSVEANATQAARMLEDGGQTFLHVAGPAGSHLLARGREWLTPLPLQTDSSVYALGLAGGQLRFVYMQDSAIKERRISPRDLQVQGPDTELQLPSPVDVENIRWWVHWGMMGLITLVMIHTYRKRDEYRQVKLDWKKVQLAPFGRRFFAGMIDLLPVITALLYARVNVPNVEGPTDVLQSVAASELVGLSILVFLAHTTIVEAIAGRSIGKIVTHLRVVRIDGQRPSVLSLLIRNVLRIVDVVLWFTLILMVYLPLRQRLGDLAAGTVVVVDRDEQH